MTVEERLENMERELGLVKRRNRWLLGAVLLMAGGLVVPAVLETTAFRARAQVAGTAKEIHARAFILEDEKGMPRAYLSNNKEGPTLVLMDEKGQLRAGLNVNQYGSSLTLADENGHFRTELNGYKDKPSLELFDEKNQTRASLSADVGGPELDLNYADGHFGVILGALGAIKDGSSGLILNDGNGRMRAMLDVANDNIGLRLFDDKGKVRFTAGNTRTKTPDGKTISYPESSLILLGPDGNVIWSAIK